MKLPLLNGTVWIGTGDCILQNILSQVSTHMILCPKPMLPCGQNISWVEFN